MNPTGVTAYAKIDINQFSYLYLIFTLLLSHWHFNVEAFFSEHPQLLQSLKTFLTASLSTAKMKTIFDGITIYCQVANSHKDNMDVKPNTKVYSDPKAYTHSDAATTILCVWNLWWLLFDLKVKPYPISNTTVL